METRAKRILPEAAGAGGGRGAMCWGWGDTGFVVTMRGACFGRQTRRPRVCCVEGLCDW
jgi:hypothetical protein